VVLPDLDAPTRVILGGSQPLGDDEFYALCMANPDLQMERTAQGEIIIVPPAGAESDYRSSDLITQLGLWAERDKRGRRFGATVCFLLPDGAGLSPDVAWVSNAKLAQLSKEARKKFIPIVPDFVIEVMSPSDRLKSAQAKMRQWIANGVSLAWLIDGDKRTIYVYRHGQAAVERLVNIDKIAADEPVAGFTANLTPIWDSF